MQAIDKTYFLHIPKNGGVYLSSIVNKFLTLNDISIYRSSAEAENIIFEQFDAEKAKDKIHISGHFGVDPINNFDLDYFTILRNPVDRLISDFIRFEYYFLNIHPKYREFKDIKMVWNDWLYSNENIAIKENFQAKFLCNGLDKSLKLKKEHDNATYEEYLDLVKFRLDGWGIDLSSPTLNEAEKMINNACVAISTENLFKSKNKVISFLENKYSIKHNQEDPVNLHDNPKSKDFKSMLTKKDIDYIENLNPIDMFLWEKSKS